MRLSIVTIFPDYVAPLREALLGKAIAKGLVSLDVHDLRDWAQDVHRSVDDSPYGGGPGMVMKPQVWGDALDEVCGINPAGVDPAGVNPAGVNPAGVDPILVVPTPAGVPFTQSTAERWSTEKHLVFACGRYEGIDQRVVDDAARRMRVEEVSIGDFVLIGGEVATMAMIEATTRLIDGVLGNPTSHQDDSFSDGLLEGPSYTRPVSWRGLEVPSVLLSGDHAKVAAWRREQALLRTAARRPDLLPPEHS